MAREINKREWNTIVNTVDGVVAWDKKKQQQVSEIIDLIDDEDLMGLRDFLRTSPPINEPLKEHLLGQVTPLGYAAYMNNVEAMQMLLYFRASVNMHFNKTDALNFAIDNHSNDALDLLLNYNAVIEPRFLMDTNPRIIRATKISYLYGVERLLYFGSRPNLRDQEGKVALFYNLSKTPQTSEDSQIGKLLLEYGSIQEDLDGQGLSADNLAIEQEQKAVLEAAKIKKETLEQRSDYEGPDTKDKPKKRRRNVL